MRKIEPKMRAWLDARLRGNGLAKDALARQDARLLFRLAAEACVGIREVGGNNRGPLVELMQETIGGADRESWCMAAVQTWLAYAEVRTEIESPIHASEHCLTVWQLTPHVQRVRSIPAPGAIPIWRHGTTSNGHTGVECHVQGERFRGVEANTEAGILVGKVERDGGGIYFTDRSRIRDGDMRIVGFLKPF